MSQMTGKQKVRLSLACLFLICFFVVLISLFFKEVPENNQRLLDIMTGGLIGGVLNVMSFYFGDSEGK